MRKIKLFADFINESVTNKEVWDNGEVVDSMPSDEGGSNASQDHVIEYKDKTYVVTTDWEGTVSRPKAEASLHNTNEDERSSPAGDANYAPEPGEDVSPYEEIEELEKELMKEKDPERKKEIEKKLMALSAKDENIQEMVKHEGSKWKVYTKDGSKLLGTHDTEKEAKAQLAAIEISKAKKMHENKPSHYHGLKTALIGQWRADLSDYIKSDRREMETNDELTDDDITDLVADFKDKYKPDAKDEDMEEFAKGYLGFDDEDDAVEKSREMKQKRSDDDEEEDAFNKEQFG